MTSVHLPTGIDMDYETSGSGSPIVLIPGTGLAGNVWSTYQMPALGVHGQVIAPDPRGCGGSTRYQGVYTLEQMGDDFFALMDYLGLKSAHIVGHSMGGRIGLAMALSRPERVDSLVIAAAGSGVAGYPAPACVSGLPARLVTDLIRLGLEGYVRHEVFDSPTYFTDNFRKAQPEKVEEFWSIAWEGHAGLTEYIGLCIARHTWEATHRLGEISTPTLVLVGDQDTYGRSHIPQARILADGIPGSRLEVIEDNAHGFFWETPEATNDLIARWVGANS